MKPSFRLIVVMLLCGPHAAGQVPDPVQFARRIDVIIFSDSPAASCDDATFLRRISLDTIGRPPLPSEVTQFLTNTDPDKRAAVTSQLLSQPEYGVNWSRYWRDAIFSRATNVRAGLVRGPFETWFADRLNDDAGWDDLVTELLTATGPVNGQGETALIFAHEGVPEEIAAEASRLFLGIQIQCANCHDHPWDRWKRDQFHELVAFFPRVSVRRDRRSDNMFDFEIAAVDVDRSRNRVVSRYVVTRLDRNGDQVISPQEAAGSPLARLFDRAKDLIDTNKDGRLSVDEILSAEPPAANQPGQGSTEHFMPDLSDPASKGTRIDPVFFLSDQPARQNLNDAARRATLSWFMTSPENEWFAKAIVNRMWYELTGTAFYSPVDDIGPDRSAVHEDALNLLCEGLVSSQYDLKWLIATISSTAAYQRVPDPEAEGFARCEPMRLRSDQLYSAMCQALGVRSLPLRPSLVRGAGALRGRSADPARDEFGRVFGFDPSVPRDELTGSIPEALFLMNSDVLERIISDRSPGNIITRIASTVLTEEEMITEIYLSALGRTPEPTELAAGIQYVTSAATVREGTEDLLWALVNSPEFMSRR